MLHSHHTTIPFPRTNFWHTLFFSVVAVSVLLYVPRLPAVQCAGTRGVISTAACTSSVGTDVEHVAQDAGRDSTLRVMSEGDFNLPGGGTCSSIMAVKQEGNSTNKEIHVQTNHTSNPSQAAFWNS